VGTSILLSQVLENRIDFFSSCESIENVDVIDNLLSYFSIERWNDWWL